MSDGNGSRQLPQIAMRRPNLEGLPPVRLPRGYTLRTYRPGDEKAWDVIWCAAFDNQEGVGKFEREMLTDPAFAPDRVFFVCRGDAPVATASAWHRPSHDPLSGYLHWVAVLPAETGKGLGYQVSLACLHKMASEHRTAAFLRTDDFRIRALKTYLKLGFEPFLMHESHRKRWPLIFAEMARPDLEAVFAAILSGPVFEAEGE